MTFDEFFDLAKIVRAENLVMSFFWDGGAGFCVTLTDSETLRTFKAWSWVIEEAFEKAFEKLLNDRKKNLDTEDPKTII